MSRIEKILVFAMISSPFTQLRFSFFGLSEIFFILLLIITLKHGSSRPGFPKNSLSKHYLIFVVLCVFGWGFNLVFSVNLGTNASAIYNYAAYVFTLLVMASTEYLVNCSGLRFRPQRILRAFFVYFSMISIVLYLISCFRDTLFGFTLTYYSMFCPLTDNIHQYAMIASPLPFLGLNFVRHSGRRVQKMFYLFLCVCDTVIICETNSFKATSGMLLGAFLLIILLVLYNPHLSKRSRNGILFFFCFAAAMFLVFQIDKFGRYLQLLFSENDNHGERAFLYSESIRLIMKYPLFGLGPSSVIPTRGFFSDAHETLFTAGLTAGGFGIVSISVLLVNCVKSLMRHPYYISALVPLLIYAAGGDILRKSAVWACIFLMVYAAERERSDESRI